MSYQQHITIDENNNNVPAPKVVYVQKPNNHNNNNNNNGISQQVYPINSTHVQSYRATSRIGPNPDARLQLLVESEILSADDPRFLVHIIHAFNSMYRFGYLLMYYFVLILTLVISPFLGIAIGALEIVLQIARGFARPVGKFIGDTFGYGTFLSAYTEKIERELHQV
eukprot:TRINITY_DN30_c2_g1_i1.p1 TRINITY_DN30_c2_g1~~TRINITY_DN30_c2_g1_i1.p1  ORF type:complete len:168 (-),score=61.62 TRINITY_DN30_c2_g1_i1:150-653(-)